MVIDELYNWFRADGNFHVEFQFEESIPLAPITSAVASAYVNANYKEYEEELRPDISEKAGLIVRNILQQILDAIALEDFFKAPVNSGV